MCRKKFLSLPGFELQLSSSSLVILAKHLDSFSSICTLIRIFMLFLEHLTPKISTYRGSVARYVRGIRPASFSSWNHTLLLQFCLGTGKQISANRLCVKGDAKANRTCSFGSNTKWFCSVIISMSVIIIKTAVEGNKCVKVNCTDSHTKLLRFWNHTKFQLCKKREGADYAARVQFCNWFSADLCRERWPNLAHLGKNLPLSTTELYV